MEIKYEELNIKEKNQLLELFEKAMAYNDEHYSSKTAELDQKLIDKIKKQLIRIQK